MHGLIIQHTTFLKEKKNLGIIRQIIRFRLPVFCREYLKKPTFRDYTHSNPEQFHNFRLKGEFSASSWNEYILQR